jgi:membrane protein implicated in regulation of membrane protease activity
MQAGVWLLLMVLFFVVEAVTVTMVSAWFAVGAFAALVASLFDAGLGVQIIVFLVASAVALALLRPVARRYFTPRLTKTNVDALVGVECLVVESVDNAAYCGKVKIGDVEWTARSTTNEPIPAGTQVRVDRVQSIKVYVTPVKVAVE